MEALMKPSSLPFEDWGISEEILPSHSEQQEIAKRHGLIRRQRYNPVASLWLRLALVYSISNFSLRETAAWALSSGMAKISDVALLNRLRGMSGFVGAIVSRLLESRRELSTHTTSRPIQAIDSTVVTTQGEKTINWRIHTCFDLTQMCINDVNLTVQNHPESIGLTQIKNNAIIIADANYCRYKQVAHVVSQDADIVVKFRWNAQRFVDKDGNRLKPWLTKPEKPGSDIFEVSGLLCSPEKGTKGIPCRIILRSRTPAEYNKCLAKQRRKRSRSGIKHGNTESHDAAQWVMVMTTLPQDEYPAEKVLDLYRCRWQIELVFKRWKSIMKMHRLKAMDPDLVKTVLLCRLLIAIVIEIMTRQTPGFSPYGW